MQKLIRYLAISMIAMGISNSYASNATQVKVNAIHSNYAQTKYPIIFVHGVAGFSRVGSDPLGVDYWHQILPDLARNGANVWAARLSPFNSNEIRGEQLLQQTEEILAITGAQKVNFIAHSQGGPTSRYVAAMKPDAVASLTSVSGTHKGSPVASLLMKSNGTILGHAGIAMTNFFSAATVWAQGLDPKSYPHDAAAAGHSISVEGSAQFNAQFPMGVPTTACGEGAYQENGIYLYSFSGTQPVTNLLDPLDLMFGGTSLIVDPKGDNDGMVSRCSAKFGRTIRDNLYWNHADEVNQVLGLRSIFAPNPVDIYRQHANRLKLQGL
ncbi:triacylglycerol lipase [Acinetobacter sp. NIPH 2699]|uniref:lipase family alpha/beta hydrolase n=1 Tax=Acinetobacter sp. NIPH 2699 TaxID=2923433 RepID=UPI001F4AF977|nr:triacylglycerol lipase [Acinetobacter sp. NIPH 2699]MCH7335865.1 triacylglycerol lipase [Acinetobacter sp. NIPH 2699]